MNLQQALQYRLPDCGPNLCGHFAKLDKNATPQDAFAAWLECIKEEGGVTDVTYFQSPMYDHWAFQIREVHRAAPSPGASK